MLNSVGQVHISVTDLNRSVAFYRDVLGAELLFRVPGQQMAFFAVGGVRLYLGVPEDDRFRSRPLLYYTVDDVEQAHSAAVSRGAESISAAHVVHRDEDSELEMAFVADPDGLPVGLMRQRPVEGA